MHTMLQRVGVSIVLVTLYAVLPVASPAQPHNGMDHQGMAGHTNTGTVIVGTTQMAVEVVKAEPGKVWQIMIRLMDRRDGTPISGATVAVRVEWADDVKADNTHQMEKMDVVDEETGSQAVEREEKGVYMYEYQFDKSGTYLVTAQVSAIDGHPLAAPFSVTVAHDVTRKGGMMGMMCRGMPFGGWGMAAMGAAMVGLMVLRFTLF